LFGLEILAAASSFDDPPSGSKEGAQGLAVVTLDLDVGVPRRTSGPAGALELTGKLLEERTVAGQTVNYRHRLASATDLLDP
jgi:hypothetical protein